MYQIVVDAQLNDLGLTGLTPPIPAGNSTITFTDSLLYVDAAVEASISGTLWGGAKYIDNFHFQGVKSADSCIISSSNFTLPATVSDVFFSNNNIHITNANTDLTLQLYAISGQEIYSVKVTSGYTSIPITDLENGVYLLQLSSPSNSFQLNKKIVILN
ncbi:MAG: T9SS type A sorting domain-containing protein [Bacteroidetes bacterium]|nr:T9SS type A sorting domain-containing protein [Bacteroidota bacterium]